MTDESTCSEDDVFNVRRLSWRSEGMYESKVISFIALKCWLISQNQEVGHTMHTDWLLI